MRDSPLWKNWAPRFSSTYDLSGNGRTALKMSVGKYLYQIGTGTPGPNPNGGISQRYAWNDLNDDLVFQRGNAIWDGTSIEARTRESFSSHSLISQSLTALAISLVGQGVRALQEGGYVALTPFTPAGNGLPTLGLYPTIEGLATQLIVLVLVLLPLWLERKRAETTKLA